MHRPILCMAAPWSSAGVQDKSSSSEQALHFILSMACTGVWVVSHAYDVSATDVAPVLLLWDPAVTACVSASQVMRSPSLLSTAACMP
jgi:hypothetical protein